MQATETSGRMRRVLCNNKCVNAHMYVHIYLYMCVCMFTMGVVGDEMSRHYLITLWTVHICRH